MRPRGGGQPTSQNSNVRQAEGESSQRACTAMRRETACSCDFKPYILVTACLFRTSDFAITLTASYATRHFQLGQ